MRIRSFLMAGLCTWLAGAAASSQAAELPARDPLPLQVDAGVVVGTVHNLGALVAPRLGVDLGADYPFTIGRLGLRLFANVSWAAQSISAPTGLEAGQSKVLLLPIGAGITYRAPLRHFTPYVMWGCMAQLVRVSNEASYAPRTLRNEVTFGALGLLGVERKIGPGRVLLQMGYQWSRIANIDVELMGGGLVLEGGYRLEL